MDVLRTIAGAARPQPGHDATTWAQALEAGADVVLDACIDLDPALAPTRRRRSDGRSLLIEPIANQATSEHVLAQEERIITWALDARLDEPASTTANTPPPAQSPATIDSSSSSAPPAPARPERSPPPSTTSTLTPAQ